MNRRKTLALCLAISLILGICQSFAQTAEELLPKGIQLEEVKGELEKAIEVYQTIVTKFSANRPIAAKAQLHIGLCFEKLGLEEAKKAYQKVVDSYPEQNESVKVAHEKLSLLLKAEAILIKEDTEFNIRKVWSPALDNMGSPSPDERYISYVNWDNGNLAVHNGETGENRDITSEGNWGKNTLQWAEFSIWSPDGQQIAYMWYANDKCNLRIVGLDGSKPRILYSSTNNYDTECPVPRDWSSDGKYVLAYVCHSSKIHDIVLISVADGSVRILKSIPHSEYQNMSLSPDGRYVVYDFQPYEDSPEKDICLLDINNGHEMTLVEHPADDRAPFWSPDGKRIVFMSDRSGINGLWTLDVTDGKMQKNPELIRDNFNNIIPVRLTRNGSYYYSIRGGSGDVFVASIDPKTEKILSPPEKAVQSFEGRNSSPSLSPDGKYLAYRSERSTFRGVIIIRSIETGEEREIPNKPGLHTYHYLAHPWTPDGSSLFVAGHDYNNDTRIYSVDVKTGEYTPIVQGDIRITDEPALSPDGKQLFYIINGQTLLIRDLETGVDKNLHKGVCFALSPDGKQLAVVNTDNNERIIQIMPSSGGEVREILRLERGERAFGLTWTTDGRYLIFIKREGEISELLKIPIEGGTPEKLGLEMKGLNHINIHPDGNRIIFEASGSKIPDELWVIENFLPE